MGIPGLASRHEELTKAPSPNAPAKNHRLPRGSKHSDPRRGRPFSSLCAGSRALRPAVPTQKIPYKVLLASSTRRKSVATNCGLVLIGTETYHTLSGPIDTLLVAGGTGVENAARDEELLLWLRKTAQRVRRVGSICTGAFLLASAGLLDGKRAATHWKWAAELANKFKHTTVDADPIYIRDGNTYTTAGVTAGMDLAL